MYQLRCIIRPAMSRPGPRRDPRAVPKPPRRRRLPRLTWKIAAALPVAFLAAYAWIAGPLNPGAAAPTEPRPKTAESRGRPPVRAISKQEVQQLIAGERFLDLPDSRFQIKRQNSCFTIQTTLDPGLQQALMQRLDQRHSRYIGIVVMDPDDGRVLALAGYDKANPAANPCLDSRFPAASIFKIITAAAAVETRDLEPDSILNFKGGKYTLYKSQLDAKPSKNANRVSLKESFAQSINPVFGKLGAQQLGPGVLESYAEAFGFNQEIDFELPIRPSRIELSGQAFETAEVASGFNRTTRISPLHGAVMAAAIVNRGRWVEPTVVDWIANDQNQIVYQARTVFGDQVIEPATAAVLRELMQATVQSGTAHKEFQKHHDDKVLSRLEIGGKTGSMGDGRGATRYDWFVGYAREPRTRERLVFSVVVAHEDYIGTRAAAYAAAAIREYFKGYFARLESPLASGQKS
jgi:cell division protein FtsI/penicillin-binding protein 2